MTRTEELVYWIVEREAMRERKAQRDAGNPFVEMAHGWSNDPFMGAVRYCNVRREDDKVTRWLAQHWRPEHHSAWALTLARMVNYIPTLENILAQWERSDGGDKILSATKMMKMLRADGEKIWTSAYTISTAGQRTDKVDYVMGVVRDVQQREALDSFLLRHPRPALQGMHQWLMKTNGLGSFLAAQVVADMKNTQGHPLAQAPDWATWSAHGPGSMRGLAAYFGAPVTPRTYPGFLRDCWAQVRPLLPPNLQDLHMQDFQNCMCEFSKYVRVKGGGHVRNKYRAA